MKRHIELTIDFNLKKYDTIRLKQMDTTEFVFKIIYGGLNVDLSNNTVNIIFTKPNNTIVIQSENITTEGNIITATLLADCVRNSGIAKMEVEIKDTNNNIVSSFYINLIIEPTSKNNITAENTHNYIEAMDKAVKDLQQKGESTIQQINEDYDTIVKNVHDIVNNYDNIIENVNKEVSSLLKTVNQFNIIIVESLPEEDIDTQAIYFVAKNTTKNEQNIYDEYICINGRWEFLGNTEINIALASQTQNGLMSKDDKIKLDNYAGGITGDTLPIGSIVEWGTDTAPANWLLCDGQAVSRTDYAELFAVLGTTYGEGDGSTTFNLPNYKGKIGVGKDENDVDFDTLGKTDGEKEHILTIEEMPQHNHGENIVTKYGYQYSLVANNGEGEEKDGYLPTLEGTETNKAQVSTDKTGKNQAHNNLQPYIVTNYIIKTHQSAGVVSEVIQKDGEASTTNVYSADAVKELLNREKVLFEGNSNSEITLEDDVNNYEYIEIFYSGMEREGSVKIHNPQGKSANASINYWFQNKCSEIFAKLDINNNKIIPDLGNCGFSNISTAGTPEAFKDNNNYIYINRVVAIKK